MGEESVRQSAKREKIPEVLELHELQALLETLAPRQRTLALLDAATGLRVSELLALRWDDVEFQEPRDSGERVDLASGVGCLQDGGVSSTRADGLLHG